MTQNHEQFMSLKPNSEEMLYYLFYGESAATCWWLSASSQRISKHYHTIILRVIHSLRQTPPFHEDISNVTSDQ